MDVILHLSFKLTTYVGVSSETTFVFFFFPSLGAAATAFLKSSFDNAPVDPTKVVNRQWSIAEATAGGSDDTLRLSWLTADQASAFDPAQPIAIMQWTGSAWQNTNASISGTGVVDDPYVAKAGGFSNYSTSQFGVTNLTRYFINSVGFTVG